MNDNKIKKLKRLMKKSNFIRVVNGINIVQRDFLYDWFRKNGQEFFGGDFQCVNSVLYGWNGRYWETGEDEKIIQDYVFKLIDITADAAVQFRDIPEIVRIAKAKKQISDISQWKWTDEYRKEVVVTFKNGTLVVDLANNSYQFFNNEFFQENNAIYCIQYDFNDAFMKEEYWKKSFVGNYLDTFYNDEDRFYLQQFLASVLIPQYQPQQGLVILGEGGDGKGVLMGTLKKLLGTVVTELSVSKWTGKHDTVALVGSLLNVTSEAPSREISLDTWKSIVACDYLTIDPKYKTPFSYKPFCKQILTVNELPKIAIDKATLRRMPIIRTCKSTQANERSECFRTQFEENKDALISFILTGLYLLKANNFKEIIGTPALRDELIYQNDSIIVDFQDTCLTITENDEDYTSSSDLFAVYDLWRIENGKGSKDIIKSTFSKKLNNLLATLGRKSRCGTKKINGKTVRGFSGVVLCHEWKKKLLEEEKQKKSFRKLG